MNIGIAPIKIALIGCGAVAEQYYAPALKEIERLELGELVTIFDVDHKRLDTIATLFPKASCSQDLSSVIKNNISLAIIASPVEYHAQQAIALLASGVNVLCEKPIAATTPETESMIKVAKENNTLLAVGLFRRYLPVALTIKQLITDKTFGDVKSFYLCEGMKFDWPIKSPFIAKDKKSHSGVLFDLGVHLVDLMVWWFGEPTEITYEDDNLGGIELNARLHAVFKDGAKGEIRLSWDWPLKNGSIIECEKGWIKINNWNDGVLECGFSGSSFGLEGIVREKKFSYGRFGLGNKGFTYNQSFIFQLISVINAVRGESSMIIPAEESIKSLRVMERCYKCRTLMSMPWLSEKEQIEATRIFQKEKK